MGLISHNPKRFFWNRNVHGLTLLHCNAFKGKRRPFHRICKVKLHHAKVVSVRIVLGKIKKVLYQLRHTAVFRLYVAQPLVARKLLLNNVYVCANNRNGSLKLVACISNKIPLPKKSLLHRLHRNTRKVPHNNKCKKQHKNKPRNSAYKKMLLLPVLLGTVSNNKKIAVGCIVYAEQKVLESPFPLSGSKSRRHNLVSP